MLIALGTFTGPLFSGLGDGGKVRSGSCEGRWRSVKRESKRMEQGVTIELRTSTAVLYAALEAVVSVGEGEMLRIKETAPSWWWLGSPYGVSGACSMWK
jgi:hypothetical protein